MDTIFHQIVRGEVPAATFYEDDSVIAFLDIFPAYKGQAVVIPKKDPGDYIFYMNDEEYVQLMSSSRKVAKILQDFLKSPRVMMVVEGLQVPYVHVKLYPVVSEKLPFESQPGPRANDEELAELAVKLKESQVL